MSGFTLDQAMHMLSAGTGTAMLGPNTRVKSTGGFLGTRVDALQFTHGGPGWWIATDLKVRVQGNFTVSQSAQGLSQPPGAPPPPPQPIVVTPGNPRLRSS